VVLAASPEPASLGTFVVGGVVILEDFGAGLGTAVFMLYLMRCCDPRHKATHMAVLTAVMSIGFTIAGMASGFLVAAFGSFAIYFAFTFVATIPSMVLLPFVPFLDKGVGTNDPNERPDSAAD
jgi:PAT family beta-lactamase induction signal transducer AmpG